MEEFQIKFREVDRKKIVDAAKESLWKPEGKEALNYLRQKRNFSDQVINQFDLGYCPLSINHQLKGRIITPIKDSYGELIAISTRHLDENHSSRFWHESFDKGSYLYGLYYAKKAIIKHKKAILVEGEFDVIALHSEGFKMTVGPCCSAFTLSQSSLLLRYCSVLYIAFDGDNSGKKSIKKVLEAYDKYYLSAFDIKYIPVHFPFNEDPNEYMNKNGKQKFKELLIKSRKDFLKI